MKSEYLLRSDISKFLYDKVRRLPIIDYHNHLSVTAISENVAFKDIYELWIEPDPYKHRAMRMCGISEKYITSDVSNFEKFKAWCSVYPKLIGNPLYIWTKFELEEIFGIYEKPNEYNANRIYNKANDYLKNNIITPQLLMDRFNVEFASPCVNLTDDMKLFKNNAKITPSLRGDDILMPDPIFIKKLELITNKISNINDYKEAVIKRLKALIYSGCKFSDHAINNGFKYYDDDGKNEMRFKKILCGEILPDEDKKRIFSHLAVFLFGEYAKMKITLQLHIGAQRYTSTRLRKIAGAAGGFACIGNSVDVLSLTAMFDRIEQQCGLPKTILFTLNPADNALISVLSGSYSCGSIPGLITQGPAWWWCDHHQGICDALESISAYGLLSNFVGMTTDSRSFLSFVRHDYFRRILCDWLGEKINNNELCCSSDEAVNLAELLCYKNAKKIIG